MHQRPEIQTTSKTIVRDGVKYYPRQDITTVLMMGINQRGKVVPTEYNVGGAADMVTLFVFDEKTEECVILSINRDLMVQMPALNEYGKEVGTYYGQLAFSHTYGDGMEDSCKNVRAAVSNLLYGTQIDYYFSMNMDAIALLNDAVGGVTVTIRDDFSQVDPELSKGSVTLFGEHAVNFVQARWDVGDELNLSRMERHKEYMSNFVPALREKMESSVGFVVDTYDAVSDYIVTDCSAQTVSRLEQEYSDYAVGETLTIQGENVLGEEYYEFYADEEALDELILRLFFAPKE
ncbi:MAG: LCP family protein [Oscillospiraceae bacterium]|nr:LCP family protein [Oscillospiraceae bacterium]